MEIGLTGGTDDDTSSWSSLYNTRPSIDRVLQGWVNMKKVLVVAHSKMDIVYNIV